MQSHCTCVFVVFWLSALASALPSYLRFQFVVRRRLCQVWSNQSIQRLQLSTVLAMCIAAGFTWLEWDGSGSEGCDGWILGGNVLINPPSKNLIIFGVWIDQRKCFDESSDQNFEYFWYPNPSEKMFWGFLQSNIWIFLVPKLIGGNILINPPIKTWNIVGIQTDRRKCSDDSSNPKFEHYWCSHWLEETFW